jgi:hypothetical protein
MIRHEIYQAQDMISLDGDQDCDLYILRTGQIEIRYGQTPVRMVHPGDCYGEANFVLDMPHVTSAQAVIPSELCVVRRHEFVHVMQVFFPDEWPVVHARATTVFETEARDRTRLLENLKQKKIKSFALHQASLRVAPPPESGVILPTSRFRQVWTVLLTLVNVYNMIQIVFRVAFLSEPTVTTHFVLTMIDYVCDVLRQQYGDLEPCRVSSSLCQDRSLP